MMLFFFIAAQCMLLAQGNDFISVRKKNGRLIKTFVPGLPITFQTIQKNYVNGWIEDIRNDSMFVHIYQREVVMTHFGFTTVDTTASYIQAFHYKDIRKIQVYLRRRFIRSKIDRIFIGIGAIYLVTNIVNGAYLNQPITSNDNLKSLGISLAAIGAGVLMRTKVIKVDNHFSTRRNRIVYIHVRNDPGNKPF